MQAVPRYTAESSVAILADKQVIQSDRDGDRSGGTNDAMIATQVAILQSNKLISLLIDQLKLNQDLEFNPDAHGTVSGFSILRPTSWFGSDDAAVAPRLSPKQLAEKRARIIERVRSAFGVTAMPRSYVIEISATSKDPLKAVKMANVLADLYIRDGIDAKYEASRRASAYLQSRVNELRTEAVRSDALAVGYQVQHGLSDTTEGKTVDTQQLSELNSQLILARSERAGKEAQLSQIRALSQNEGEIEASGIILQSPLIMRLREQESEVLRKLAELQGTYGQNHPKLISANAELRDLRSKIRDEVRKVAVSTQNEVAVARAREGALASSLSGIEGRVNQGGQAQVRLRELQREADANKSIYEVFLNQLKETGQQIEVQSAESRIISPATIPLFASSPRIKFALIGSILTGLLLGTFVALILEKLDNTVRGAELVEKLGGGATMAFLPIISGEYDRPEDTIIERPQSMAAEALRTLRSAIALSDVDNPPKVVMTTSSVPAEGKTFVSLGLARVSAQAGARTILVDADMRHPRVHSAAGIENGPGLIQVLGGQVRLEDALVFDKATGLSILTAGSGVVNPPDLLRSDAMKSLLHRLRSEYEMVVMDTPPFTPMTDSQILTGLVDKVMLVIRWGSTPIPVVQNTLKQIDRVGAPLVGSVMSRVHLGRQAYYGYGDQGYHYSKYGAYYGTQS